MKSIIVYWTMQGILTDRTLFAPLHLHDRQPTVPLYSAMHPRKRKRQDIKLPLANRRLMPRGVIMRHDTLLGSLSGTVQVLG